MIRLLVACLMLSGFAHAATEIPGPPQKRPIVIEHATVHTVAGGTLRDAAVVFEDGKLTQVGTSVRVPQRAQRVDATGQHVYPGLFNTDGILGLVEINAVRATNDMAEVGRLNPNVRADVAVNPDSELIPVTRSGGVLLNLTTPQGGLIAGMSAVLQLDGWTTEDLTLKSRAAMHLNWPSLSAADHQHEHEKDHERHAEQLTKLEATFDQAQQYHDARTADPELPVDLRWEAMRPVMAGELPLVVSARKAAQIQAAVAFASRRKLKLILYGAEDALACAPLLRAAKIPVIVSGVYRLPLRRHAAYDAAFAFPSRLEAAGIPFCIAGSARFDASNIRNLPYHAAMAAAFGLSRESAVRAMTLSPAEILGVADRVGSLEAGKDATLIVTDGDILDTATHVVRAYVQGRAVDLSDRHKRLFNKYEQRLKQQQDAR